MTKTVVIEYTNEEREACNKKCSEIIDSLKAFSINQKWLIISTLYNSFPKEHIEGFAAKDGDVVIE